MIIRIIFGIMFVVVALAAASLLFGVLAIDRSLAIYEGKVEAEGLKRPVEIYRDSFAIAHIYGENDEDCYFGLGYGQAQERMFQMDFSRRVGRGRLAEILGAEALIIDKWARTIGFARIGGEMRKHMSPETKKLLEAYTAGVNAYIAESRGRYGFEFDALSYKPEPWTVEDCFVIGRLMSWEMNFSFWTDATFSDIALKLNDEQLASLMPTYPPYAPTTLEGSLPKSPVRPLTPKPVTDTVRDTLRLPADTLENISMLSWRRELAAAFNRYGIGLAGGGTNAFAVSPRRSASRGALIENDLHLAIRTPARFYLAHLESKEGLSCAGFTVPGVPIFTSGRNRDVAWGVTNGMIDEFDYVILTPEKNGEGYKTANGTKYVTTSVEQIPVRQKDGTLMNLPVTIRTSDFGPLISDFSTFGLAKKFMNDSLQVVGIGLQTALGRNKQVAMLWNGSYTTGDEVGAFLKLTKARTANAGVMAEFATPCLNLVTADARGNIAYQLIGRIPRRSGNEERLLLPRHSDDSDGVWQGFVTTTTLPHTANPAAGFIISANNPSTRDRAIPHSMNWEPPARAERIEQLLRPNAKLGVNEMNKFATDYVSLFDRDVLLPPLLRVVRPTSDTMVQYGRLVDEALDYIENWDGAQRSEDVATTILQVYMIRLFVHAVMDELEPALFSEFVYVNNVPTRAIANLLDDEWNILWDDVRTPDREERDTIIRRAFFDAVKYCESLLGNDLRRWNWGRLHTLTYKHPFADASKEVAAIGNIDQGAAAGSLTTVVQSSYSFWQPFRMLIAPSMRFIADMSTNDLRVIQPTGNSGNLFNPHYRDMARMFYENKLISISLGAPNSSWKKLHLIPIR